MLIYVTRAQIMHPELHMTHIHQSQPLDLSWGCGPDLDAHPWPMTPKQYKHIILVKWDVTQKESYEIVHKTLHNVGLSCYNKQS